MITISGASDDLVEVGGCVGADEFGSDNWSANLIAPDGQQMHVTCWYDIDGTWQVGVGQVDEAIPLADWPLRIRQGTGQGGDPHRPYSVVLELDAPDGTRLRNIKP